MGPLWQDLRYALRMLVRNPGFSLVVMALVAVGVGVNTTVFTMLNAYLLRPLPYERPDEIVMVQGRDREGHVYAASYPDYLDWRRQATSFEELSCYSIRDWPVIVTAADPPDRCCVAFVSGNFFRLFPARPAIGRLLSEQDDLASVAPTVVISHAFWRNHFGGDPDTIGRPILLNGVSHTIVGVTLPTFQFPPYGGWARTEVWVAADPVMRAAERENPGWYFALGRLRSGVNIQQAQAEMETVCARLVAQEPSRKFPSADITRLHDWMRGDDRQVFPILMGTVLMVFLAACANAAGLMFARGVAREREMTLRSALGAGRLRLIRLMLVENGVLALLGGGLGVLGASWTADLLARTETFIATRIPAGFFRLDWRVLGFALALSILAVPIFGLLPSIGCSGVRLARTLAAGGRSVLGSRGRDAAHSSLLGAQVAITIVLLVAASLMMRSLVNMMTENLGFNPKNILLMDFELSGPKYARPEAVVSFYRQLLDQLRAIPGVGKAGLDGGKDGTALCVEGEPSPLPGRTIQVDRRIVSPGYFETMQIPLLSGRCFDERDDSGAGSVAIVDQTLAERYWPNGNPIGKRIQLGGSPDPNRAWIEVVGVVGHIKGETVDEDSRMQVYRPLFQEAPRRWGAILIRTASDPKGFIAAVKNAVYQIDREQLACDAKTMEEVLWWRFVACRVITSFLSVFAGIALALSAAGIYAVTRYSLSRRTQEFGIRMALGADRNDVLALALRKGLLPVLIGACVGLAGAVVTARVLRSLLYQLSPWDPVAYGVVSLLLIGVALLACYLPARKAAKIDPMAALRYE
jgi:putative ABC transport system permease protein